MSKHPSIPELQMLGSALQGRLITPDHIGWDEARAPWQRAVEQRPAAVVLAASAEDVVAVADFARAHGLRVAAQGTGHNAGPLGPLPGHHPVENLPDAWHRHRRRTLSRPRRGGSALAGADRCRREVRAGGPGGIGGRRGGGGLHPWRRPGDDRPPLRPSLQPRAQR